MPKAQHIGGRNIPRRLTKPETLPVDVPGEANAIKALELVMVQTTEQMHIWNELMIAEHYLGTATLVGRQIRYLIRTEQGWLGGIDFAVAPDGLPLGILKTQCAAPQTRLVSVCDREADFFELFDEQRRNPGVDLLIRAQHNRNIKECPAKLFAAIRQAPVQSRISVHIPKQSARSKKANKAQKQPDQTDKQNWHCVIYQYHCQHQAIITIKHLSQYS